MADSYPRPDRDRISTMTALVLLAYALIRVAELPTVAPEVALAGLVVSFEINTRLIMLTLTAALAATGADWLLRSHPENDPNRSTTEHWILPGLASFGFGAILSRLPEGLGLWLGLPIAALLLTSVLVAEYIVHDSDDPRYDLVALVLRTLAYLLLAGLLFAFNGPGMRAIFSVPLTFSAAVLVSWRLMILEKVSAGTALRFAVLIAAVAAQLTWALHYWPTPPLQVALINGLSVYLSYNFIGLIRTGQMGRGRLIEISIVGIIGLLAIVLIR
jgi:hypothetical protein